MYLDWSRYWPHKIIARVSESRLFQIEPISRHRAKMYKNAHSSSTLDNKTGVLSTPYASRTNTARISTDYPKSLHRTMVWKKTYFSLSDPHLTRYFQNKLLASFDRESSSRPSSCLSTPRSKASTVTGKYMYTVYDWHMSVPPRTWLFFGKVAFEHLYYCGDCGQVSHSLKYSTLNWNNNVVFWIIQLSIYLDYLVLGGNTYSM